MKYFDGKKGAEVVAKPKTFINTAFSKVRAFFYLKGSYAKKIFKEEQSRITAKPGYDADERVLKALGVPNDDILKHKTVYENAVRFNPGSAETNHKFAVLCLHEGISNNKTGLEQIEALDLAVHHFTKAKEISEANGGKNTLVYAAGADIARRNRHDLSLRYASY